MARSPRNMIIGDDAFFHITWQCHNKDFFLKEDWAKSSYYNLLKSNSEKHGVKIFSYCFMSSHPHLAGHCRTQKELSKFMQVINTQFARIVNKFHKRSGQVIQDRFVSPQIQDSQYLWNVMTYIDLNPVKAKIVKDPRDYKFSSYRYYAYGEPDPLIDPCPEYEKLGKTPAERQRNYREMVAAIIKEDGLLEECGDEHECDYSNSISIGDPRWVKQRYDKIMENRRNIRLKIKEREKEKPVVELRL